MSKDTLLRDCDRLAFPMWILSIILLKVLIPYGAYFSMMTGSILLLSNILYATIRNSLALEIPFEDDKLVFHWGWCFWLNMITGKNILYYR